MPDPGHIPSRVVAKGRSGPVAIDLRKGERFAIESPYGQDGPVFFRFDDSLWVEEVKRLSGNTQYWVVPAAHAATSFITNGSTPPPNLSPTLEYPLRWMALFGDSAIGQVLRDDEEWGPFTRKIRAALLRLENGMWLRLDTTGLLPSGEELSDDEAADLLLGEGYPTADHPLPDDIWALVEGRKAGTGPVTDEESTAPTYEQIASDLAGAMVEYESIRDEMHQMRAKCDTLLDSQRKQDDQTKRALFEARRARVELKLRENVGTMLIAKLEESISEAPRSAIVDRDDPVVRETANRTKALLDELPAAVAAAALVAIAADEPRLVSALPDTQQKSPVGSDTPRTEKKPRPKGRRRLRLAEANQRAMDLAEADKNFVHKPLPEWAEAIGCAEGQVPNLPLWQKVMEMTGRGKKGKAPRVVTLTEGLLAATPDPQAELCRLVAETTRENEPSPLQDDPHGMPHRVRVSRRRL
jgi:hypothetical protein